MTNYSTPTVSNAVVNRLIECWQQMGCEPAVIEKVFGDYYAQISNRTYRLPVREMTRIFTTLADYKKDNLFGLHTGNQLDVTRLGVISNLILYAPNIGFTLKTIIAVSALFSQGVMFEIQNNNKQTFLLMSVHPLLNVSHHQVDTFVACIANLFYTVLPPYTLTVSLQHDAQGSEKEYQRQLRSTVLFNQAANQISFSSEWLQASVPWSDSRLFGVSKLLADQEHKTLQDSVPLPVFVKSFIQERLLQGEPDQKAVASALRLGIRSFQNKLKDYNIRFQDLVVETRKETALQLLNEKQHSIEEIAYLLGYSDKTAFYRAFKRWTGVSALDYIVKNKEN